MSESPAAAPLHQYLDQLTPHALLPPPPQAVAIGVFDGVHRGHQALLAAAGREGEAADAQPVALTFTPHPAAVFAPDAAPKLLCTLEERAALLRAQGAVRVIVARFDAAFAALTPDDFIRQILVEKLNARAVIVGDDFRFGRNRAGDCDTLRAGGETHGFRVHIVAPVAVNGIPARSSVIRQHIIAGQVEDAAQLLGRPYSLSGMVVHGRKLGRTLGYPTANLASPSELLIPAAGVYAGRALLADGAAFRAAISVGTNPTVTDAADAPRTVEAFLMDDFSGDLYDQPLTLQFLHYLRPTLKFDGLPALVDQMRRDVEAIAGMAPFPGVGLEDPFPIADEPRPSDSPIIGGWGAKPLAP